ncbi:MAG: mechanosensitive ion channel domain-containing protein, partial [Halieaceae bacterium]|nr:mechanosensitive ion channel domain-containing protein [Halieaceae bacterium]
ILSLLGIIITAVIALSSTTFVSNIMAGLMLRAVNSFRPGDYIRCEQHFGRVTERGLFHTEIQTPDRDLATVPNLFLVNNPLTVVHESGTIISAELSLGYDIAHQRVEELLKQAATDAGLSDAFVLVGELGDFSVIYRVGGFAEDVSRLLTTKSNLRRSILTTMHAAGVEIVSPNFMNQRVLDPADKVIPKADRVAVPVAEQASPEEVIFDKAETAAQRETLKQSLREAQLRREEIAELKKAGPADERALELEDEALQASIARLEAELDAAVESAKAEKTGSE